MCTISKGKALLMSWASKPGSYSHIVVPLGDPFELYKALVNLCPFGTQVYHEPTCIAVHAYPELAAPESRLGLCVVVPDLDHPKVARYVS